MPKTIAPRIYKGAANSVASQVEERQDKDTLQAEEDNMMNRLVISLFAVFVIYYVQGLKIKGESSLNSRLLQDNDVHSRQRRSSRRSYIFFDNRSNRTVQLWWRGKKWEKFGQLKANEILEINSYVSRKWRATDATTKEVFVINNKKKYRPQANTEDTRAVCIISRKRQKTDIKAYIETLVVVDKSVRDQFKNDNEAKRYVEILLMLSSNAYKHHSLTQHGLKIEIIPSEIVILNHEVKFDIKKGSDNLYTACTIMNQQEKIIDGFKFDHKFFLTKNQFGAAGYARFVGMCSRYSSCSIVRDQGFHSAYFIAHEIGHSIGLSHGQFPQNSRYIMNSLVDSLIDSHRWSTESQLTILSKIRKYDCLGNEASTENNYPYPGKYFSFQRQCDLEFDPSYTAWKPTRWEPGDPCAKLQCRIPGQWSFITRTTNSSALDGTECGDKKFCLMGRCQPKPGNNSAKRNSVDQ